MMRYALYTLLVLYETQAYMTDQPSFADRLNHIYEKLEKFTIAPSKKFNSKLYAKLDRLNSLKPEELTDEDEELLSAMQMWGTISDDQLKGVVQEFQNLKDDKSDREDYSDGDWNDDDDADLGVDYANDDGEEWDPIEDDISSTSRPILGVTPSAFTRLDGYRHTIVSAVDPIAATNERPRILDDSHATPEERSSLRKGAVANVASVVKSGKCLIPQPRWFFVRKLAPAADTVYMPPCVQLHRCAPDAGCCYDEAEVCAPVDGKYVAIPFLLNRPDKNLTAARILFFNHTRCACVSRDTLQSTTRTRIEHRDERREERKEERIENRRAPTEEPILDDEQTSPPQLKRVFILVSLFMTYFGTCSVYTVIIAKNIMQVVEFYMVDKKNLDIRIFIIFLLIPLIFMVWIRNLKYLAPVSMIANFFMAIGLGITFYFIVGTGGLDFDKVVAIKPPSEWPEFFSLTIFAIEAIGVIMPLENSMKTPRSMLGFCGVLNKGMTGVTLIYILLGFLGYLRYGDAVEDSITLNLEPHPGDPKIKEVLSQIVKIAIAIAVYCTFGLQFFVCIEIMWNSIKEKFTKRPDLADYIMRTIMVTLCVLLAVAVPTIGPFMGVIGAFCFSILGLIVPAFIEVITYWDIGFGRFNYIIWKNALVTIFGLFALVFGTKDAVISIIHTYTQ